MRKGFFLLLILLFPSIIYLLFSLGKHNVEKIRSFGTFSINVEGDTVYAPVPDMIFMDHNGAVVHFDDLRGKPVVLDLFNFPCDDPCRKKGVTLVNYLNELPEREKWVVLSLSMEPGVDAAELLAMEQAHLPEMTNWYFAAAEDGEELAQFLDYVYVQTGKVRSLEELPGKDFALIDQQGVIRAYFDSRIYKENRKLEDAVKLLLQEPFLTWKEQEKK